MTCKLAGLCGGCPRILDDYQQQLVRKQEELRQLWSKQGLPDEHLPEPEMVTIAPFGLRDRVDMTLHRVDGKMRLGLYDMNRREIVDIKRCPQMSEAVAPLFAEIRENLPNLPLGSFRLRVAPDGRKGIWLHFPNAEIARFLEEQTWLTWLMERFHVEMGQRRKTLRRDGERLVLDDPQHLPWFETYLGKEEKPQPLFCNVGSFTQVGFRANRVLVGRVMSLARQTGADVWLELGSGIGNFTLPLANEVSHVTAVENDRRACLGLERGMVAAKLEDTMRFAVVNMHRADDTTLGLMAGCQAVLADPPRSGLRGFVDVLLQTPYKPRWLLYVSCFAESLVADTARLYHAGWRLRTIEGVDQFPQSFHCEWVTLLERCG